MIHDTFNTLALEFVKQLSEVFPENTVVAECAATFGDIVDKDPNKPTEFFLGLVGDNAGMIHSRHETLWDTVAVEGIDAKEMWTSMSNTTRDVTWQYMKGLLLFSSTLGGTSGELMSGIEQMATEFAEKMVKGDMDVSTMLNEVMQRVKALDLSSLEGADIGAFTESLGIDQSQITTMMNKMLGGKGGINHNMMKTITSLMGGDDATEQDILKLLESARPPKMPKKKSGNKPAKGKKARKQTIKK
jgi:hypothetical protein